MNPKFLGPELTIYAATLVNIADKRACRFVWRDSEDVVGLMSYVEGRYTEHHRVSRLTAKHIWRKMVKHGWTRLTKAPVTTALDDSCAILGARSSIQDMVKFNHSI